MTPENDSPRPNSWLSSQIRGDEARVRLFCLPHAGGGAAVYNIWKRLLPSFVEVSPIQIPGRENRLSEPPCTDSTDLINQITCGMASHLDKPYAIFGHSMGSLLALDLARNLRANGLPTPNYLFVSGRNATHVPMKHGSIHQLPDEEFLTALSTRYGGLPQEILETPDLLELYLPILRADLTLLETHRYEEQAPLDCPIAAFAGKEDRNVSEAGLNAWGDHTSATFETRLFDGDHFYLTGPSRPQLLHLIAERLGSVDKPVANQNQAAGLSPNAG